MFVMRWYILATLFAARTTMGFQFQSVASAAPFLTEDLHLSYGEAGTLIGLYLLPGLFLAIPSGLLQQRFGDKAICCVGLFLMAAGGALIGLSDNLALALFGRFWSGVGAVLLNLVVTKKAMDWFAGREISFAMSAIAASWGVGIAVGLMIQVPIATILGWRWLMHLGAILCVVALVSVLAIYTPPKPLLDEKEATVSTRGLFGMPPTRSALACIAAGTVWGIFNAGLVNFFSFTPAFLNSRGVPLVEAASITSLTLWISIFSIPIFGYLVQKSGKPDIAICLFSALTGLLLASITEAPSLALILCAFVGLAVAPPVGSILALPSRVVKPEKRAMGLALFYTSYYILAAAGPAIAGSLRDTTGNAALPLLFGAVLFILVPFAMFPFWNLAAEQKPIKA